MIMNELRLAGVLTRTEVNGPGSRTVVWTQGCDLACPGCWSPHTHSTTEGYVVDAYAFAEKIAAETPTLKFTISGGEPFQQVGGLALLIAGLRDNYADSIIVYTGYTMKELMQLPKKKNQHFSAADLLNRRGICCPDVLVSGRFNKNLPHGRELRSSSNQTLEFLTDRYSLKDFDVSNDFEVHASGDLSITTGFPPNGVTR